MVVREYVERVTRIWTDTTQTVMFICTYKDACGKVHQLPPYYQDYTEHWEIQYSDFFWRWGEKYMGRAPWDWPNPF